MVAAAIPKLPPRLRIRLNMLVALPISSLGMGSMVAVVSGTNSIASAAPWMNCGQKMSQYPASRFSRDNAYSDHAAPTNPHANTLRGSNLPITVPTTGIIRNEPSPRGAMAMPAFNAG